MHVTFAHSVLRFVAAHPHRLLSLGAFLVCLEVGIAFKDGGRGATPGTPNGEGVSRLTRARPKKRDDHPAFPGQTRVAYETDHST